MTHPGMTPVVATVTPRGPDVYDAALDFTMAGDWMLIATVRLHDGRRARVACPGDGAAASTLSRHLS